MLTLQGIPVSPGFADGVAVVYDYELERALGLPLGPISDFEVESERGRIDKALEQSNEELETAEQVAQSDVRLVDAATLMSVHSTMAREIADLVRNQISGSRISAEEALETVIQEFVTRFEQFDSRYFREREQDIRDVGRRMMRHLSGRLLVPRAPLPAGTVLVTRELLPSEAVELVNSGVVAILSERGGTYSHTAIIARSLGIPAITGIAGVTSLIQPGMRILVDGERGCAEIAPTEAAEARVRDRAIEYEAQRSIVVSEEKLPCVTQDGFSISLFGNIGLPREVQEIKEHHLAGVGLFRTEFLFLESLRRPSLEEQAETYGSMASSLGELPLTIRTFDLGGDKLPPFLISEKSDAHASLALRGLRFSLRDADLLATQLKAILQVARSADVRILFPMVIGPDDFAQALAAVESATSSTEPRRRMQIGAMIETPAALFALDEIFALADFAAIGTNDLTQFMLAVDRDLVENPEDSTAMHPAVLRAVKLIVEAAAVRQRPVCVCGEEAGDIEFACLLVGLGVRELSLTPSRAAAVRQAIRRIRYDDAREIASLAVKCQNPREVRELCRRLTATR